MSDPTVGWMISCVVFQGHVLVQIVDLPLDTLVVIYVHYITHPTLDGPLHDDIQVRLRLYIYI